MGKMASKLNPLRNFNVESRAHKVIGQNKPRPAPKFKVDQLSLDKMMQEYPEVYQESLKKHPGLDSNLKDVYVISNIDKKGPAQNPERPLPSNTHAVEDFEFGMKEPDHVPIGRISLRNALTFITNHQADPKLANSKSIAEQYSLSEDVVKNILKYFKVFEVYIPQNRKSKAKFAGPSGTTTIVIKDLRKAIESGTPPPK